MAFIISLCNYIFHYSALDCYQKDGMGVKCDTPSKSSLLGCAGENGDAPQKWQVRAYVRETQRGRGGSAPPLGFA